MTQPVLYIDTSEVEPGRIDELKPAMEELAEFVRTAEPQLLTYNVYFSADESRMSVVHLNPDSASLELHMQVAGPRFAPIGEFIRLIAIDVYGAIDERVVEALRSKARLLGGGTIRLHEYTAGFTRLNASPR